ncbi:MAG: hypothetical protein JST18_05945 [Bacteroidetes bacterium]|nr:hypothetical protein [Bacteroidota bacterium]
MKKQLLLILLPIFSLSSACTQSGSSIKTGNKLSGTLKDVATGLTARYEVIQPGEVYLVMNDEVLNHTDIPIGESFSIMNKDVKGLKVKDGKISIGCSLTIADSAGNKLLDEADLFAGGGLFNEADASLLRCTVNTGEPMQWEEHYTVTAVFWDKYGDGKIENVVVIRAIDIP